MYCIYKLTNQETLLSYIGLTKNYKKRMKEHVYTLTVETPNFISEIISDNIPTLEEAYEKEKFYIRVFNTVKNGYNKTQGGKGVDSETAKESNRIKIANGTHHFLGGEIQRKRVKNGTHHLLDKDKARERANKRVKDGTHNFLGNSMNQKRIKDGTHPFLKRSARKLSHLTRFKKMIVYQHIVMIPKAYWEVLNTLYKQRKLTREGFFDKEIPDTSNSEQLTLF